MSKYSNHLTEQEQADIMASIYDVKQPVYAWTQHNSPAWMPSKYTIYCANLPNGVYHVPSKNISLHPSLTSCHYTNNQGYMLAEIDDYMAFKITGRCTIMLLAKRTTENTIKEIVTSLRYQTIKNRNKNNEYTPDLLI